MQELALLLITLLLFAFGYLLVGKAVSATKKSRYQLPAHQAVKSRRRRKKRVEKRTGV